MIEPVLLGCVRRECLPLLVDDHRRINIRSRRHRHTERIAKTMRHGVVNKNIFGVSLARRWIGFKIGHPFGEGCRHGQSTSIGVILHIILWRMGEDNRRLNLPHHTGDFAEFGKVVKDFQIIANRRVKSRSQNSGGILSFAQTNPSCLFRIHLGRPTTSGRKIKVMNLEARFAEEKQSAGPKVFDVIGVGKNSESGLTFHGSSTVE